MDKIETLKTIANEILAHMKVKPQLEINNVENNVFTVSIQGDSLNFLIGYRGQSLDAFKDMLTQIYYKRTNEWPAVIVDINGYTDQRIDRLHNIAKRFIDRVRFFQAEVEMPAMNAWERRQIHTLIGEYDDIESESRGEGRNRKLYLKPKKRGN